ncbi:hypothetical protein Tco_0722178 [Tanacetum coccineum]
MYGGGEEKCGKDDEEHGEGDYLNIDLNGLREEDGRLKEDEEEVEERPLIVPKSLQSYALVERLDEGKSATHFLEKCAVLCFFNAEMKCGALDVEVRPYLVGHWALRFQEHSLRRAKRPKSKKPPTKTKVTPPKPTEGFEQSHSVSSGTVPDPQDLERNIQLASTGLPSTLNEGTRKSKPLPESTATPPKDSGGNIQPLDRDITSTTSNEGTTKTMSRPEGTDAKYQVDQTRSTRLRYQSLPKNKGKPSHEGELDTQPIVLSTYADVRAFILSNDEIEEDILGAGEEMDEEPQVAGIAKTHQEKYEEAAVNYADLKAFVNDYYDENIAHRDQNDKLVEASMSSLDKSSNTISDLYKGLNIITELLKEIKNAVKDDSVINKKITEASESFTKFSTNIIDLQSSVNTL